MKQKIVHNKQETLQDVVDTLRMYDMSYSELRTLLSIYLSICFGIEENI